jgi:O-antigen ligase
MVLVAIAALRRGRVTTLEASSLIAGTVGMVVSGARGAMILTLGAIVLAALMSRTNTTGWLRRLMVVVVAAAVVGSLAGPLLQSRFSGSLESASFEQRLVSLRVAADVVLESPFFGVGPGGGYDAIASRGYAVDIPETEYAGQAMGLGIPGLVMVVGVVAMATWSARRAGHVRWAAPLAVYSLGVIGTHNFFDWWGGAIFYFTAAALIAAGAETTPTANTAESLPLGATT